MFMPSERNWNEMKYERAGFWPLPINNGEEYAFVAKLPTSVIKAAFCFAPTYLTVARTATPLGDVMATALVIVDDPQAALSVSGVERHKEEQTALIEILRKGETLFIFVDELSRPVARANCTLSIQESKAALRLFETSATWYIGPWGKILADVLDELDGLVDPTRAVPPQFSPTLIKIPLQLTNFEINDIVAIGEHEVHRFRLDNHLEGMGLEQSTWQLLESLIGDRIFRSPQIPDGKKTRELTDILAFCELGVCLFESKETAVLSTDPNRGTARRASNLRKQISKAAAQLVGAYRSLERSLPISTMLGHDITIPSEMGPYRVGVIMVSELLPALDWEEVAKELLAAADANSALIVLDLQELRMIVGISSTPEHLFAQFIRRYLRMKESGTALIRIALDGPPLP